MGGVIGATADPKKCVWCHTNCPRSANMFMIRAPFPRAIGTDFSRVLESIGSTEGRVHPMVRMYWPKETSPSIINGSWKPLAVIKVNGPSD